MKIGLFTDGLMHLPFGEAVSKTASLGVQAVEIGTGNFSPAAHCDLNLLLSSSEARREFLQAIDSHHLQLAALNCSGNPIHPNNDVAKQAAGVTRKTLQLAGLLDVERVVCMSGCPGTPEGGRYPNWVVASWPEHFLELLDWPWRECIIPYWSQMAELAKAEGVRQLCFELHPGMCVYNVSSFQRLRAAVGPVIAANLDPSHFFWMGMDPLSVVDAIGERAAHCHGKDVQFATQNLNVNGLLDRRWPHDPRKLPWNFAVVGRGRDAAWWRDFVAALKARTRVQTIAIEHEDPFVAADLGIPEAAELLALAG